MTIAAGTRLGRYEIRDRLASGGMGDVYVAGDPHIGRSVAVKVLPPAFGSDEDRIQRFEQEARAVGRLNHPNILSLFDVGSHDGSFYVVYELLEGGTLREQLRSGPIPARKAVEYSLQVARGLAAAHAKGIVHRDLKPENVFVTRDDHVKILDFGLAKLLTDPSGMAADGDMSTRNVHTHPGVVMGTVGYMAPEQVRGEPVDQRADIFSLGVMLHEMLSGRRAFDRESLVETLHAILKDDPPDLPETGRISPSLDRLVRHCLEKQPDQRFQSARDLAFHLESVAGSTSSSGDYVAPPPGASILRRRVPWVITAAALLLAGVAGGFSYSRRTPDPAQMFRFNVTPPGTGRFQWIVGLSSAISPDGERLVLVVTTERGRQLFVRRLDSPEPEPLAGTDGARDPFWSPDSRSIAYFTDDGELKRIDLGGGSPQTICQIKTTPTVVSTWGRDGTILFTWGRDALYRVAPRAGSEPIVVRRADPSRGNLALDWPYFLPDGRHYLFLTWRSGEKPLVAMAAIDSPDVTPLLHAESRVVYAAPGYLLFVREGALFAQPFDPGAGHLSGEPVPIAENMLYFDRTGFADFSASDTGVLAYQSGRYNSRLVWYGRDGLELGVVGTPADYSFVRLSPDGQRLAFNVGDARTGTTDVWVVDLAHGGPTHFTFDPGVEWAPVWSPDGKQIAFSADRNAPPFLHVKDLTDTGSGRPLVPPTGWVQFPWDWTQTAAGQFLVYQDGTPETSDDLMVLPLQGGGKPRPFHRTRFDETQAQVSPNGQWIAYVSDESGQREVYVAAFDGSGEKRRVSTSGGFTPRWRRDGKEMFYLTAAGTIMAAAVSTTRIFEAAAATPLFHIDPARGDWYDVSADGRRFLVNTRSGGTESAVTVAVNWPRAAGRLSH